MTGLANAHRIRELFWRQGESLDWQMLIEQERYFGGKESHCVGKPLVERERNLGGKERMTGEILAAFE